jgi:hypothetical protein
MPNLRVGGERVGMNCVVTPSNARMAAAPASWSPAGCVDLFAGVTAGSVGMLVDGKSVGSALVGDIVVGDKSFDDTHAGGRGFFSGLIDVCRINGLW